MKRTAWLINVGRGAVVQEDALAKRCAPGASRAPCWMSLSITGCRRGIRCLPWQRGAHSAPRGDDHGVARPHQRRRRRRRCLRMLDGERPNNFVNPAALNARAAGPGYI